MVCGRDEEEGGGASLYNGSRIIGRSNAGADDHAAMHDEMIHCTAWESREAINTT
jgi:hypothetical protein